jgi:hypothetical protein
MGMPVCSAALSSSAAIDTLSRVSAPSVPKGVAIPAPGVLIGNSSSSWIGIGADIFPITKSARDGH